MTSPPSRYVQLYPTTRCNQRCVFCFNKGIPEMEDLSFPMALRLLDILEAEGVGEIDVMGGEPLLLPWMAAFAASAVERNFRINISTNGSMPGALAGFSGIDSQRLAIGISLEGSSQRRHRHITASSHFSSALRSLEVLVSLGFSPVVKTVVDRTTMSDVQNIIDLVRGTGVTGFYVIHRDFLREKPAAERDALSFPDFLSFYEDLKRRNPGLGVFRVNASCFDADQLPAGARCAAGVSKLSLLPDGSVFPCNLFHGFPGFRLGNIFSDSLRSLWPGRLLEIFGRYQSNRCEVRSCTNRNTCTGGCPAHAYSFFGDPAGPDIRCRPR